MLIPYLLIKNDPRKVFREGWMLFSAFKLSLIRERSLKVNQAKQSAQK
jgi:hypothetical protein